MLFQEQQGVVGLGLVKDRLRLFSLFVAGIVFGDRSPVYKRCGSSRIVFRFSSIDIHRIDGGGVFFWWGACYDARRRLVEQTAGLGRREMNSLYTRNYTLLRLPPSSKIGGTAAIFLAHHSNVYYHWIFDVLPKVIAFKQSGICADHYVVPCSSVFQRQSLSLLGINLSHSLDTQNGWLHYRFDELYVPHIVSSDSMPTPEAVNLLRSAFQAHVVSESQHPARIYVSRGTVNTRRVINEAEVERIMESRGYSVIHADQYSFAEQIAIFGAASHIVAPHGSALANLVFCKPGTVVVELMPSGYDHAGFRRVSAVNCLCHSTIIIESSGSPMHDVVIEPDLLLSLLCS